MNILVTTNPCLFQDYWEACVEFACEPTEKAEGRVVRAYDVWIRQFEPADPENMVAQCRERLKAQRRLREARR